MELTDNHDDKGDLSITIYISHTNLISIVIKYPYQSTAPF